MQNLRTSLKLKKLLTSWRFQPSHQRRQPRPRESGQAMVEYALIAVLVAVALSAAVALTGPAVGNIFSNTVYNLMGQTTTPYDINVATINAYGTKVWEYQNNYATFKFQTNTPAAATCKPPKPAGTRETVVPQAGQPTPLLPTYAAVC
jgi:pilus assembly protein Flp/PilA